MYEEDEDEDFASFGEMRSNVPQPSVPTSTISSPPSPSLNPISNSDRSSFLGNGKEDEDDFAFGFKPTFSSVTATSSSSSSSTSSTPTPMKGATSRVEEEDDDFDDGLSPSRPVGLDEEDFDDGLSPSSLPQDFEENFDDDFSTSFKKNPSTTIPSPSSLTTKALSTPSSTFGDFGKFSASFDEEGDDPFTSFSAVAPPPSTSTASSFACSSSSIVAPSSIAASSSSFSSSSSSSAILPPSSASTPSLGAIRAALTDSSSNFFTSSSSPTSSLSPTISRATIDENDLFKEGEVKPNQTPSPSSPSPSLTSLSSLATEEEMLESVPTLPPSLPLPLPSSSSPSPSPSTLPSFSSHSDSSPKVPHSNDDFFSENTSQTLRDKKEMKEEKAGGDDFGFTTKSDTQDGSLSLSLSSGVPPLPQTPMLSPPTSKVYVEDDGFGNFALPPPTKTPLSPPTSFSSSPAPTQESDDDGFGSFALPPPAAKPSTSSLTTSTPSKVEVQEDDFGFGDDDDDFGFGDFAEGGDDDDDAFADFQATPTPVSAPTAPVQQVTQTTAPNPLSQMAAVLTSSNGTEIATQLGMILSRLFPLPSGAPVQVGGGEQVVEDFEKLVFNPKSSSIMKKHLNPNITTYCKDCGAYLHPASHHCIACGAFISARLRRQQQQQSSDAAYLKTLTKCLHIPPPTSSSSSTSLLQPTSLPLASAQPLRPQQTAQQPLAPSRQQSASPTPSIVRPEPKQPLQSQRAPSPRPGGAAPLTPTPLLTPTLLQPTPTMNGFEDSGFVLVGTGAGAGRGGRPLTPTPSDGLSSNSLESLAEQLLLPLPDLSFMLSKTLVIPPSFYS